MSDDPDGDRMRAAWDAVQRERKRRHDNLVEIIVAVIAGDITAHTGWRIWRITRRNPRLTVTVRPPAK